MCLVTALKPSSIQHKNLTPDRFVVESSRMTPTRLILGYLREADSDVKSTKQSDVWISGLLCWVNVWYFCIENTLSPYLNGWVCWVYSRRVVSGTGLTIGEIQVFYIRLYSLSIHLWVRKLKSPAILRVQTCSNPARLWRKMGSAQIICSFYCL